MVLTILVYKTVLGMVLRMVLGLLGLMVLGTTGTIWNVVVAIDLVIAVHPEKGLGNIPLGYQEVPDPLEGLLVRDDLGLLDQLPPLVGAVNPLPGEQLKDLPFAVALA